MHRFALSAFLAVVILALGRCGPVRAQGVDPQFKPVLVEAEFSSREVRPGDPFTMTLRFRNEGTRPGKTEYRVFTHFEAPERSCENIVIHADHEPTVPTTTWAPGQIAVDGPIILYAPTNQPEQEYFVHVGIFDHQGTGARLLETYEAGKIRVTSTAKPASELAPEPLEADEIARRAQALASRIPPERRASLDGSTWRVDLDRESGAWQLVDKRTGVLWASAPDRPVFAQVTIENGERRLLWDVARFDSIQQRDGALVAVARPQVDGRPSGVTVTFTFEPVQGPDGVRVRYASQATGEWKATRTRLLHNALWTTDADSGTVYVPHRIGIELPASEGLPGRRSWRTYDSLSMAMCGVVRQGSALLVNWSNVDTNLEVNTLWSDLPVVPGRRTRALSLEIASPEGECTLHPLGRGGYVEIAHAYRPLAREKGWLETWADKREEFPTVDRMFGAANFKPFVFSRVIPGSRYNTSDQERTHLGFTFDEVAQCAEHWRNDLGIDRAYVVMAGWINGGYDVRHPDVLPAAPECGGNEEMRKAFDRIKACGYLVGGHDNYQDMYENAPSWSEDWLNKDSRGRPKRGGNWNGGQAWQVCAIKQVELAAREKTNLPEIKRLFEPTIYFIDTVFAWGLVTCEDPNHPMTRQDDLEWKTRLCMLAKEHFGMFGSEEGREWAVPCADYLEGIFGHVTDSDPGAVIPLFNLVYSDCVQIMTHQGNRIGPGDEKKMADHILFAEMGLPRFGEHLYWQREAGTSALPVVPLAPAVEDLGDNRINITYRWRVDQKIAHDFYCFVHFTSEGTDHAEKIAFQNDHNPVPATSAWQPGTIVNDGPHTVAVPAGFRGPAPIMLGMTRAGERIPLSDARNSNLRYHVGTLLVTDDGVAFEAAPDAGMSALWSRGDNGWTEGLCMTDRVIKNTWEVLSPLNVITAERGLDSHEFLSADRKLQRSRFGDVTITVTYDKPAEVDGVRLPPYGFVVESPTFVAFCATKYNGIEYGSPVLFTARSLDGKPIAQSSQVRIYHGFGDSRIRLGGRTFEVQRESVVSMVGE